MVQQYLDHARAILAPEKKDDVDFKGGSKGMRLISLFGYQNKYDLSEGFPLMTTRKMGIKTIANELIWFMRGEESIKYLVDSNVHIWDDNAFDHNLKNLMKEGVFSGKVSERYSPEWKAARDEYVQRIKEDQEFAARWSDVGPLYGSQWRHWKYVDGKGNVKEFDQLGALIEGVKKKPTSKRTVVTAWNPGDNLRVSQPSCHILFQLNGTEEGKMDLHLYQRSCDMFLGVPFNIASYAMLTQVIAQQVGLEPRRFVHTFGDSHFYAGDGERGEWYGLNLNRLREKIKGVKVPGDYLEILDWINTSAPHEREDTKGQDHVTGIIEQLARTPRALPRLEIVKKDFDKLTVDDFVLREYNPYPIIKRVMAV